MVRKMTKECSNRRPDRKAATHAGSDPPPNQRVFAALRQIVRAIDRYSRSLVSRCEVTGPQLVCLHMIHEEGPLTSRDLSRKVHLDPSTLVGIVDRLEKRGFVERQRDSRDRRAIRLHMTEAGQRFVKNAPSPLQATLADGLTRLPPRNQVRIADSLEQVARLMQADDLPAMPILAAAGSSRRGPERTTGD